ncbi:WD40-repeat-containing domain protein, partial [Zopfochytrium polystomum]
MWLNGVAGVGKSVMAAMVSRELQAQSMLGGLFFCKHDDEQRSSARNLVLTLVFGLAKFSIHFGKNLLQAKQDDPTIVSRSVFEIMKVLLVQPLDKVVADGKLVKPVVLLVDALDECGVASKRAEILSVFQELNRLLPANVKILVTGRPEEDIAAAFKMLPLEQIEPSAEENLQDQISFTRHFLESMDADSSVVTEGSNVLVSKSAGVFVWLVTACNYLNGADSETITLSQIQALPEGDKLDGSIDTMYNRTFAALLQSAQLQNSANAFRAVLSVIVLAYEPLSAAAIASLLLSSEPAQAVVKCIRMLEPVLVLDTSTRRIRIFHKSVKDYLTNPSRCTHPLLQVDPSRDHAEYARLCFATLETHLRFNMADLPFADFHSEIPDFDARVEKGVPEHVRYAVRHFWEHCVDGADSGEALRSFMNAHGHHYLEASSLINSLDLVIPAMSSLQKLVLRHSGPDDDLSVLLQDVRRVIQTFLVPLRASALQVYFTAVPFSPSGCQFHRAFASGGAGGVPPLPAPCPRVTSGQPFAWPPCTNVLEGHRGTVNDVGLSRDGRRVLSASDDCTARIWSAASGRELLRLAPGAEAAAAGAAVPAIRSAAFSRDDGRLVTAGDDGVVRVWDADTGRQLLAMQAQIAADADGYAPTGVLSAVWSDDDALILSVNANNSLRVWDAATGAELHALVGHTDIVTAAAFSRGDVDGGGGAAAARRVVSGSYDGTVRIWSAASGAQLFAIAAHPDGVSAAAFSPDGRLVVSAGHDGAVRIWTGATGAELRTLEGHSRSAQSAGFSPDGAMVVSGANDGTVRIWDAASGRQLHALPGHGRNAAAAFSPDGRLLLTRSEDTKNLARVWSAESGRLLHVLKGHAGSVCAAAFSADGRTVVTGGSDSSVRIWSVAAAAAAGALPAEQQQRGHAGRVQSAVFSPDGESVVSASDDKTVRVWSMATGSELLRLEGHTEGVNCAVFSTDGRLVASGGWDETVRIWDVSSSSSSSSSTSAMVLTGHTASVNAVAFSPDAQTVASAGLDDTVRLWHAATGAALRTLTGHSASVASVRFSHDGARVVSAAGDGTVRVWDAASGGEIRRLAGGHAGAVRDAAFAPRDRGTVLSAGDDGTVRVW